MTVAAPTAPASSLRTLPAAPTVSAVVVNFNGGERVLACLRALDDLGGQLIEIIVADNGSTDGGPERIAATWPAARVLRLGENRGLPAARNAGLAAARGDLVLLVDADVYVTAGAVEELCRAQARFAASVVCPRVVFFPESDRVQCDGAAPHFIGTLRLLGADAPHHGPAPAAGEVAGCIGACMLLDRRRVLEAGGFNETFFFYFEDLEFSLRLRLMGHVIACAPSAVVLHDRGEGTAGLSYRGRGRYPARRAYLTMRNRLLTLATCYRWSTVAVLAPALLLYEIATLALALRRGWGGAWLRAWGWLAGNVALVRRQRRRVQAGRRLPDHAVLVGGPLPLADGLLGSAMARTAAGALSRLLDRYWRLVRGLAG
jgi:GT2 family glycosyltransferase